MTSNRSEYDRFFSSSCRREVSKQKAQKFAEKNGMLYIETSALNSSNVVEAFSKVAQDIYNKINSNGIDVNVQEFGVKKIGGES